MSENFSFRYEPRLIEEAVFFAQRNGQAAGDLGRQRSHIYEIADPEERERLFSKLYEAWFVRLGLGQPIQQAFREQPLILSEVKACLLGRATKAADEGAELFVRSEEDSHNARQRTVRILLRPESLLSPESLLTFLRHELFHIADMLDPVFAYEPVLPSSEVGPTYDSLLRDRYRALWDTTINGRMVRRGWLRASARSQHLCDFAISFPMLRGEIENVFTRFFDQEPHSHPEFVAFSQNPRAAFGNVTVGLQPGSRCALCGFPTYTFVPQPESLDRLTIAEILHDFPQWHPSDGLCAQCGDLYRAKCLSLEAAKLLPGWHAS
jgi:hypothetical protein